MKKLMLLGGTRYTVAAIEAAHKLPCGVHVITADYLPKNIAHKYSDEYCNVNITDGDAVLREAKKRCIDGILSFATDPGVVSAAYTADKLGLPIPAPYESVVTMQNKGKFRDFLEKNGFNTPKHRTFSSEEEALELISDFTLPVVIKPVDSAGSKGVTKVEKIDDIGMAIKIALDNSISKQFIVEEFIDMRGSQSGSDSFVKDGKLIFASFDRQYYDIESPNPFTPVAMCYPSDMPSSIQKQLRSEIQRAVSLLGIGTSIINVECRLGADGNPYIMELSPRAGGNRVPEIASLASGIDLVGNSVKAALGLDVDDMQDPVYDGAYARVILHTNKNGIFNGIYIDDDFKDKYLVEQDVFINPGDKVKGLTGANQSIGLLFTRFPDSDTADRYLSNTSSWMRLDIA